MPVCMPKDAWQSVVVHSVELLPAAAVVVQRGATYAASASSPLPPSAACCAPAAALPPACITAATSQGAITRMLALPSNTTEGYVECMEVRPGSVLLGPPTQAVTAYVTSIFWLCIRCSVVAHNFRL